jgi:hypothetical protein
MFFGQIKLLARISHPILQRVVLRDGLSPFVRTRCPLAPEDKRHLQLPAGPHVGLAEAELNLLLAA